MIKMKKDFKIIAFAIMLLLSFTACEKNDENRNVVYQVSDIQSQYKVKYLDETGILITKEITPASDTDHWEYEFTAKEGSILYLLVNFQEKNEELKLQIIIEGRLYKQAASINDTTKYYLTISGTVPYE
jgi:hypothetical protein